MTVEGIYPEIVLAKEWCTLYAIPCDLPIKNEGRKTMKRCLFLMAGFMALLVAVAYAAPPTPTPIPPTATMVPPTATKLAVNEFAMIAEAAEKFYGSGNSLFITNDQLYETLNDGDPANDPFLMDVCAAADYAKGTIKGSANIPRAVSFKAENLAKLPAKDKPTVTYCYTGTGASGTAMVLNLMGYKRSPTQMGHYGLEFGRCPLGHLQAFPGYSERLSG